MSIEQQREYVKTLKQMWLKTFRVCGIGSKPELAMCEVYEAERERLVEMEDCYWRQLQKLKEMEADNA